MDPPFTYMQFPHEAQPKIFSRHECKVHWIVLRYSEDEDTSLCSRMLEMKFMSRGMSISTSDKL